MSTSTDATTAATACPDGGTCHHQCPVTGPCFRVLCCGPLSAAGYPDDRWPQEILQSALAAAAVQRNRKCARCGRTLVDEDEVGWYYRQPVTDPETPGLTFMDRVHECDGRPHDVIPLDRSPEADR